MLRCVCFYFLALLLLVVEIQCDANPNIIIIGAGAAGIAAATRLLENNFTNVQVFEAENRIGGRIYTVPFGRGVVDLGAEFCHGEKGNVVYELANPLKLLASDTPHLEVHFSEDGLPVSDELQEKLLNLTHSVVHRKWEKRNEDEVCGGIVKGSDCLEKLISEQSETDRHFLNQARLWISNYKCATESCLGLDDLNLLSNYEECEGDQMIDWRGHGFKAILDVLMRKHPLQTGLKPLNVNVTLNSKVLQIANWDNTSKVQVFLDGEKSLTADHVIFTPSLGVLKARHRALFSPGLPQEKVTAISDIGFGVILKIAMQFIEPWWLRKEPKMLSCMWSDKHHDAIESHNLTWIKHFVALTPIPGNENTLMAWFSGKLAPAIESLSDEDVINGIKFIFTRCFSKTYPNVASPKDFVRSRWWTQPNFLGAFSYESMKSNKEEGVKLREILAKPILNEKGLPTLLFAGEATHQSKFATVHGAIETGYREADRIIRFYKKAA